jgi:hypothetical protein
VLCRAKLLWPNRYDRGRDRQWACRKGGSGYATHKCGWFTRSKNNIRKNKKSDKFPYKQYHHSSTWPEGWILEGAMAVTRVGRVHKLQTLPSCCCLVSNTLHGPTWDCGLDWTDCAVQSGPQLRWTAAMQSRLVCCDPQTGPGGNRRQSTGFCLANVATYVGT